MDAHVNEQEEQRGSVVTFRAPPALIAGIEAVAASEGISKSDVARRAAMREIAGWVPLTDIGRRHQATQMAEIGFMQPNKDSNDAA